MKKGQERNEGKADEQVHMCLQDNKDAFMNINFSTMYKFCCRGKTRLSARLQAANPNIIWRSPIEIVP